MFTQDVKVDTIKSLAVPSLRTVLKMTLCRSYDREISNEVLKMINIRFN